MRNKRFLSITMCLMVMLSTLAGCGNTATTDTSKTAEEVKITVMNSKAEIQVPFEEAAKTFKEENPNISVEIIPCPVGTSPFEKVSSLYASNNAPTITILDGGDIVKFESKALDLSGEKWVSDTPFAGDCTIDGKVMCFPVVVEGCGLIYNKAILEKAGVDPASIKTRSDLSDALKKVEAAGVAGSVICKEDWSLGNHLSVIPYTNKSKNKDDVVSLLDELKAGTLNLSNDSTWLGFMDTFDLLMKYNQAKDSPLSCDYAKSNEIMANGKAGFLFQGVWAWPEFEKYNADPENFGYIPVPVSDNASDIANSGLQAGPTKFAIIDKDQNNADQQAAAKKFLEWLVYSPAGQEALVTKAQCISPFKNVELEVTNPLGKSITAAIKNGNTLVFTGNLVPSDHWKITGASWQKYLAGKIDRTELAEEINAYWKSVK